MARWQERDSKTFIKGGSEFGIEAKKKRDDWKKSIKQYSVEHYQKIHVDTEWMQLLLGERERERGKETEVTEGRLTGKFSLKTETHTVKTNASTKMTMTFGTFAVVFFPALHDLSRLLSSQ